MVETAEKTTGNKPGTQEGDESIKKLHSSESQRGLLQKRVTGVNRDKRIEAALLFISGVETSPTRLAEKFGVVKNSILRWKKKDGWAELAHQTDQITRASLPEGVASFRIKMIGSLEDDLALIDSKKHNVPAKSLEGLLKAKAALQGELSKLLGIGHVEEPKVTIVFGGYGEAPAPRGAVQIPSRMSGEDERTPRIGALTNGENTGDTGGVPGCWKGGKCGSIENHRGNRQNEDSGAKEEERKPERVEARGGRELPDKRPGRKIREGLTLEEATR